MTDTIMLKSNSRISYVLGWPPKVKCKIQIHTKKLLLKKITIKIKKYIESHAIV